eukprot:jgi/Botrbrau1/22105/Bobra.0206s0031.1
MGRAKRETCRVTIGDLTLELLSHICSFLEQPCGLWTARMVSRAFRAAANSSVSHLKVNGCIVLQEAQICYIRCRVSPELLRALHKRPRDLHRHYPIRLARCKCVGGVKLGDACYAPEFLPHICEATIRLPPSDSITTRPLRTEECTDATCLVPRPVPLEVALAHMPLLRQLWLSRDFKLRPTLIPHLTSMTSLQLSSTVSHDELAALASVRSIKSLRLTLVRQDVDQSASQVQLVCSGAFSHLRSLSLETVKAHVWCLSALTCLTRLSLTLNDSGEPRLEHLAALTGLQELHIQPSYSLAVDRVGQFSASCPFLSALTALTRLQIDQFETLFGNTSELLTLTALARLRKLSLGFIKSPPSYEDGSPLPRELAFLGTATTLQDLDCTIALEYFQELSTSAYAALQHALARLGSLTRLHLVCRQFEIGTRYSYLPLELCSCATSLQSLVFEGTWSSEAAEAPRQGMFSSLRQLRCLILYSDERTLHPVSLLDGINSSQLTVLALDVDRLTPAMMEPILRLTQLRDLALFCGDSAALPDLLPLSSLRSLTRLEVYAERNDVNEAFSGAGGESEVEKTLAAVQANLQLSRHESGWPPLELELYI